MDELREFIMFKELCSITGITGYEARRFIDKYHIEQTLSVTCKFMETKSTFLKLATAPEMYHKMSDEGKKLIRELRESLQRQPEPQDAA
jgi:hypothetical protein